jgi:hypothetical protein
MERKYFFCFIQINFSFIHLDGLTVLAEDIFDNAAVRQSVLNTVGIGLGPYADSSLEIFEIGLEVFRGF